MKKLLLLFLCGFASAQTVVTHVGTANHPPVYATSTSIIANPLVTDNGTIFAYTGTGGITAASFNTTGSVAGFFGCKQGTAQATVSTTVGLTCPTSVTAYNFVFPGAASDGFLANTNASNIVTQTFRSLAATSPITITNPNGAAGNPTYACATCAVTVASGAKALATSSISSAACSAAQTATATGTLTTDVISATFNGDPTAVTGYVPLTAGGLTIYTYPTTDTVNFKVCNFTSGSITPGAITLNWRVAR